MPRIRTAASIPSLLGRKDDCSDSCSCAPTIVLFAEMRWWFLLFASTFLMSMQCYAKLSRWHQHQRVMWNKDFLQQHYCVERMNSSLLIAQRRHQSCRHYIQLELKHAILCENYWRWRSEPSDERYSENYSCHISLSISTRRLPEIGNWTPTLRYNTHLVILLPLATTILKLSSR